MHCDTLWGERKHASLCSGRNDTFLLTPSRRPPAPYALRTRTSRHLIPVLSEAFDRLMARVNALEADAGVELAQSEGQEVS